MNRPLLPATIPAERTPLVLHVDRLRSVPPPPRSRAFRWLDAVSVGVLWILFGALLLVIVASLAVEGIAALGPGGAG